MVIYSRGFKGKKIDIFVNGCYYCSTNMHKTCKAAKVRFLEVNPKILPINVKCYFDKKPH